MSVAAERPVRICQVEFFGGVISSTPSVELRAWVSGEEPPLVQDFGSRFISPVSPSSLAAGMWQSSPSGIIVVHDG
jgi:hypothetical protein